MWIFHFDYEKVKIELTCDYHPLTLSKSARALPRQGFPISTAFIAVLNFLN